MNWVSKIAHTIIYISTLVWLFLFPLFFLPFTTNFFEPNKLLLTIAVIIIDLVAWALIIIADKRLVLTFTPATVPLLLLGVAFILSTFLGSKNAGESIIGRGSFFAAMALLSFITVNTITTKRFVGHALYVLIGSATLLSLISVAQSIGFGPSALINKILGTTVPDTLAFTPAGSPLALLPFLGTMLVLSAVLAFTRKEALEKIALFLLAAIMTSGLVLIVIFSFPGKNTAPVILPPEYGYAIALETLKNTKTALLGYGPESFVVAYNQTRPATVNLSTFWNIRFTNSSNELFQAITTGGLITLIAWILITLALLRLTKTALKSKVGQIIKFVTVGLLFLFLLLPGTYLHLFIFFVMVTLWAILLKLETAAPVRQIDVPLQSIALVRPDQSPGGRKESPLIILPYILAIPILAAAVALVYYTAMFYSAEATFKLAVDAANRNEGVPTYDLQRDTIVKYPYMPRYRRAYSVTNLALANAIAGKQNLTDDDRSKITQLIQQSIREAKAAVTLDPDNAQNWENLAVIYRSLIGIAQNADSWTIASLAQAIQTDPLNPNLRLELGGVFYALGQYDQAIRLYQQASELKPDWANSYYNLAAAYKMKKEPQTAFDYLRQTLSLLKSDSADYAKAQAEMTDLSKQLNLPKDQTTAAPPSGELQVPSPAPTVRPENRVNLPGNAGPNTFDQNVTLPKVTVTPAPTTTP